MAQKRMFDKKVVCSDKFIDLPNSSKALYFMAGMEADDKGFFQPRLLQRMCGFSDDDYKILIAKGFFITFESGVMVVTDWNKNNWLDSRRITETEYIDELNMLRLINQKYELNNDCLANAKPMLRQNSIEENRIEYKDDDNIGENNDFNIFDYYQEEIGQLSPRQYEIINNWINEYGIDKIKEAINISCDNNVKTFHYIKSIIINGVYKSKKKIKPEWIDKEVNQEQMSDEELEELEDLFKEFKKENT